MLIFLKWNGFLAIFVWQKSSFCRFYCSSGSYHQETLEITRWFNNCMRSQRHNRITFTFCTKIGEFVCTCHPCRPYRILPLFSSSRRGVHQPVPRFPQYNIMVRFVIFPKGCCNVADDSLIFYFFSFRYDSGSNYCSKNYYRPFHGFLWQYGKGWETNKQTTKLRHT